MGNTEGIDIYIYIFRFMRTPATLFCLLIIGFSSCTKPDYSDQFFLKTDSILGDYLISAEWHQAPYYMDVPNRTFIYFQHSNNNKLTKRIGGSVSDVITNYTNGIYDTVEYISQDHILLFTINTNPVFNIPPSKREIFLVDGYIQRKITYDNWHPTPSSDTIDYYYDVQNRLCKTKQSFNTEVWFRDYQYDNRGNLQKIIGKDSSRTAFNRIFAATEEDFGGYDNKKNPLKGTTCLWQDLLYRTLSTNNFTNYIYRDDVGNTTYNAWTLSYNANGEADFTK
jgi:hypothetical protein